jgi:hypothetical protein
MSRCSVAWVLVLGLLANAGCEGQRAARAQPLPPGTIGLTAPDGDLGPPQDPAQRLPFLDRFGAEVARFAKVTPRELAARTPAYEPWRQPEGLVKYLERIENPKSHGRPAPERALHERERAVLRERGFVVSPRLGAATYAELYHRIYEHDQPVLITADSILHAFHMSYDRMLAGVEEGYMSGALGSMLAAMTAALPELERAHAEGTLAVAATDADLFLAVARSLLKGAPVAPLHEQNAPELRSLLASIRAERTLERSLFGRERLLDFSQMKPRGHYAKSETLQRYFRSAMWLGRTQLELSGPGARRDFALALVLHELLERARQRGTFRQLDALIKLFVGHPDSMDVSGIATLLQQAHVRSEGLRDQDLAPLLQAAVASGMGTQHVDSAVRFSDPNSPQRATVPASFTFFPQRFTLDSWALRQLTYDRILVDGHKVPRSLPSGVDVAFAVLGNDVAAEVIAKRIEDSRGQAGRDGLPFQHHLLAARSVIDARPAEQWNANLYDGWLSALRALSEPTLSDDFPRVMRTRDWSLRRMQTQLASWAELRHDTILYVEQSYSLGIMCEYPAGFVELQPAFFEQLQRTARSGAQALSQTLPKSFRDGARYVSHLQHFADIMAKLHAIAARELRSEPLLPDQLEFLRQAVEMKPGDGCDATPYWDGWYIGLYLDGETDALDWDALVADVHTSPDQGILHQATGDIDLLVATIERGGDAMAFAGPVAQHYELVEPVDSRLNDEEWRKRYLRGKPERAEWMQGWVVEEGR